MEKLIKIGSYITALLIAAFVITGITNTKLDRIKQSSLLGSKDVSTIRDSMRQLDCLALNVYREAGSEPFEGKVAVAQVTMNRVAHPRFPKDVCAVVQQKSMIMEKVVCQFSWYCESVNTGKLTNNAAYKESYEVAKKVLFENFRLDVMKEALYFHAVYVNPQWPKEKIGKIGNHVFYKDK
jgi:spore germination cell wall hydrolase CwlJ-like protein